MMKADVLNPYDLLNNIERINSIIEGREKISRIARIHLICEYGYGSDIDAADDSEVIWLCLMQMMADELRGLELAQKASDHRRKAKDRRERMPLPLIPVDDGEFAEDARSFVMSYIEWRC